MAALMGVMDHTKLVEAVKLEEDPNSAVAKYMPTT